MPLTVTLGHASLTGPRARNEDFVGAVTPEGAELDNKGLLGVVADGVGGHANGREAAEFTVRSLLSDYYATPDTWAVPQALDKVIGAANRWLVSQSARRSETAGMATTLSAVVLRGRRWITAHVGDSRIYLLREGQLRRLTQDHVWEHPELKTVLSRAVGLDKHLSIDFGEGELNEGDCFILLSDGVWGTLRDARIQSLIESHPDAQEAAFALADGAVDSGAQDNCTALVIRVSELPRDTLRDSLARLRELPLPPRLKPGQSLDGLEVLDVLHDSRITLLYRVRMPAGGIAVLKTLHASADLEDAAALAHEEWIARRVTDAAFPQVIPWPSRSHLYYLMSWHEGESLKQRLTRGHRFNAAEVAETGERLLKGLATLHRLAIVHRDIKPDNLHLGADGRLRILDLGVAAADGQHEGERFGEINNPGTPSYMAPELFQQGAERPRANESSDLYAVGVTLYELATRKYPYGEIEPFQHPRFGDPVPPTRYRPDLPEWLESVLLKAVAREPERRFETAEEFLLALQRGAHRPLAVPRQRPLLERDPHALLKLVCALSLIANLLLLLLFLSK
ncbi:bifunctional protein-serine/threonine kinase/phosphatase [Uliginosibacterium sp. 31-12]|uniref:bifunctional protein-serine/threonine kinase/phosphatase n=1 Tax=Uliginosibacterium sp. 31-12 TaxID=3062781 RepID=UPI0026E36F0A|nr:bifunctional protein-serine/threonine kinase/phosphatase [Uliginosibacterium sp. 31-12]MDO6385735.1 bifunctional protein-serine/threonine kinase/phosphatase [Uliginosibacterium sp. 31-12]